MVVKAHMDFPYSYFISSPKMMINFGRAIGAVIFPGLVIYLDGELGTGKTMLVRGIALALGWPDVRSPSFTLINEYPTDPPIAHVDLYRLKESEIESIGIEEYVDNGFLVAIEWGKPGYFLFVNEWWHVVISYEDDMVKRECRKVLIRASGEAAIEALKRFNKRVSSWGV